MEKKKEKGYINQDLSAQYGQGMSQTFTPPSGNTTFASTYGDLMNMASPNMLPGGLIRQSNDILYGHQFQPGTMTSSPTSAVPTPVLQQPITQIAQPPFMTAVNPIQQNVAAANHPDRTAPVYDCRQSNTAKCWTRHNPKTAEPIP